MLKQVKILTKMYDVPEGWTLRAYERAGGYQAARKALSMPQAAVIDEMKKANVRGRGGAGFPAGVKWGFMKPDPVKPAYLVVNADEGEPGTFKDRTLMEKDPHRCIEGCIIGAYAIGAHVCYIYVRDELPLPAGGEAGAAQAAQARVLHQGDDVGRRTLTVDTRCRERVAAPGAIRGVIDVAGRDRDVGGRVRDRLCLHERGDLVAGCVRHGVLTDDGDRGGLAAPDARRVQHPNVLAQNAGQRLQELARSGKIAGN